MTLQNSRKKKYIEGLITSARGEKDQICSVKETKCSVINVHKKMEKSLPDLQC